jgi:LmbE family N-acetylglucosaminyl deacetylase
MNRTRKSFLAGWLEQLYRYLMVYTTRELSREELEKPAIVFSPHPDDETLGCGGTLIRKIRAGAPVDIVFLTDGCRSHRQFLSGNDLREIRAREALAAARKLGVGEEHVIFLGIENGKLDIDQELTREKIRQILLRLRPEQIFIPYRREPFLEHSIANEIIMLALVSSNLRPDILEYPIWFWKQWPWVSLEAQVEGYHLGRTKKKMFFWFGLQLLKEFRCSVYIEDLLDLKQAALAEHKSQMTRLNGNDQWTILSDVGEGCFLNCFFQRCEVFHQYHFV